MVRKSVIIAALIAVIGVSGFVYRGKHLAKLGQSGASASASAMEKKVLYWYDAMNPTHTFDKPGKASDGMDLVPKYAEDETASARPSSSEHSGTNPEDRKVLFWYDPMHPAYKADKPGIAPDCGMQLVPKYAEEEIANLPSGTVKISTDKQQLIGVRTAVVERKPLLRTIRTTGQVTADETRIGHVHVKINGFIEKVNVDYVGQLVKKGEPLFTMYSPDLVATQEEYLIAKRGDKTLGKSQFAEVSEGGQALLNSARQRLKLWDISDEQIRKLDESGEVSRTMTFYSPVSGFVTDRKAFPQTAVNPDMELYTISDLSDIWVNADIFEYEVPYVRLGQKVKIRLSYSPGKTYTGKIIFIYPTVDPITRTIKVRIDVPNAKFDLKPQMFANVEFDINYGDQITIPQEAILDSGNEQTVFVVHKGGVFEPRQVSIGPKVEGNVGITSGLKVGETIVSSGTFLIDSESRLESAMGGMKH
jgi:Cu(I)/Ag(I) efflux system membrane fusion protein